MAFNFNFGIPQLRQNALMEQYDAPQGGYDWNQPMVDYSSGEMPQMQVNMPPPSVGPVQDTPPAGLFGREYTPSMTGAQPTTPQMGAPPAQVAPPPVNRYGSGHDTLDLVNKAFTPDFTDRDRLRALMDAAPERGPIGWGRGLSAIALGIGSKSPEEGLKAQESVLYAPHRRAMADWTARTDPFLKTAELENRQNINERTLTSNVITSETAAKRLEENARQADQKNEVAQEKNRITRLRAEIAGRDEYEVSARGPTIIVTNKHTGKPTDTGIKTGWMTEADKIDAEGKWGVEKADAYGAAAADRARISGAGRVVVGNDLYEPDPDDPNKMRKVQGLPEGTPYKPGTEPRAGAGGGGGELESNRKEQGVMERLWATDEDGARAHITKGTSGKFEWKKRPVIREDSWFPGDQSVTQAQVESYDRARKAADPTYVIPKTAAAPPKPTQAAPTPRIRVEAGAPINEPKFPEININKPAGSTKGLGPQNVPDAIPSGGYKTQTDANNPMNKRRSPDGGRTWEVSHDGGKTWGK